MSHAQARSAHHNDAPTDAAVDLSDAVLLFRYLLFCRRMAFAGAMVAILWGLGKGSAEAWVASLGLGGLYLACRVLYRPVLIVFSWAMIPTSIGIAAWALWMTIRLLQKSFTVSLIVPFSGVILFFYVSNRVLRKFIDEDDAPLRKPGDPFYIEPSFSDRWLSGGWRSTLLLTIIWTSNFPRTADQMNSCLFLGVALFAVVVNPWALIPSARVIGARPPLELLRAVLFSRPKRLNRSYTLFLLREGLKLPVVAAGGLLVAGVLVALTVAVVVLALARRAFSVLPILIGLTVWTYCSRLASRHILSKAMKTIDFPSEPFTLYLRSFIDDDFRVLRDGLLFRVWLTDLPFNALRYVRFEEALAETMWPYGKLLTLRRPGAELPDIGALRMAAKSDQWQQTILEFVDAAQLVIMAVGFTSGLRWELAQFDNRRLGKLVLTFVPEHPDTALSTWRQFTLDVPALAACGKNIITQAVAARFRVDESAVFFVARKKSLLAYRLALLACLVPFEVLEPHIEFRARANHSSRTTEVSEGESC